ncbi:RNA-binding domain-containing protein [Suillus decipiens]|nr:RNA-binding domain-containing protein [Suillus decipiens]
MSDSDDSPKEKKPTSTPAGKKGKGKVESSDSSDSSSSDESSSDEVGDNDVEMQDVQAANGKRTDKSKLAKAATSPAKKVKLPISPKEVLAKAGALKASISKASDSSDESSDSSSEDEQPKQPAPTSDSDDSSDDEKLAGVPAGKRGKGRESGDSSDSYSSDESSSDQNGDKGAEVTNIQPAKGTKRKAEAEPSVPPKKVKLVGDNTAPSVSTEETKSIFVGRLSWNVDNDWLAQEFASCGEIVSAQVQTDRATGKSRGFGYVHFTSADAVEKALQMNGKDIDGRPVNIDKSTPPDKTAVRENRAKSFGDTPSPVSSVLFVGNLSFGVNEDQLWEVFGEHGDVKSVRVPTDRESGRPKGFAYVEFSALEAAQAAYGQLQGYELDGRSLRLDYSQPRDNAGGGRGGGRGGFGDRGRGRGGFGGGDRGRGRGGFGGDRGGRGRGRGGDRGGRGGGRGRGGARTGAVTQFEGSKITFD